MYDRRRINDLVEKFFQQSCTAEEKVELAAWIQQSANDEALREVLETAMMQYEPEVAMPGDASERVLANLFGPSRTEEADDATPVRNMRFGPFWKVAASVALLLGCTYGWYAYMQAKRAPLAGNHAPVKEEVLPGGNKAVLTLADGSSITLDSAQNGALALQGGAKIIKLANGQLAYSIANSAKKETLYNTITTPRGGQYRISLPDGSVVWLNAASSLRFPASFTGSKREVELKGEAYFEVARNENMPFHVTVKGIQVAVLGTSFNVNAYDDENTIATTLITGSVKVMKDGDSRMLRPGQQAQLTTQGTLQVADEANVEEVLAWKDGRFQFESAGIEQVMRQIARWYNIEVIYRGPATKEHFSGGISRNVELSKVFKMLEATGAIHLSVENGKVVVES
ncbi:FecR domain-containing protein [Chitinophaga sp. MM2321]|uniref:FecR family protein n=1 Tax=Chitinophaga sp. MM2321 TaxID=3137178 RepID=UPI0032D57CF5